MTLEELLQVYASQRQIAKEFGFSQQRVNNWAVRGAIPQDAQFKIAYVSDGRFKVDEIYLKGKKS